MREITFYYPWKSFPTLSVTGRECALDCSHCRKTFLQNMIETPTPQSLLAKCLSLWHEGTGGVLVSGGCDDEGRVPLFFDTLGEVKKKTGLIVNVHTGFVDERNLEGLKRAQPDYISFDIPTDFALRNVYGLPRRSKDYMDSLLLLKKSGFSVVPHVCLGMNENMGEEREILEKVSKAARRVVLNIVFPTRGTDFEGRKTDAQKIIEVFRYARPLFDVINLGCMRPRRKRIEEEAVMLDGIVLPTQWARAKAQSLGLRIKEKHACCVVD